jgi:hypothetical protein
VYYTPELGRAAKLAREFAKRKLINLCIKSVETILSGTG